MSPANLISAAVTADIPAANWLTAWYNNKLPEKAPNTFMLPGASHSHFSEELMPQNLILKGKMASSGQEEGKLYLTPSPRFYIMHLHIISSTVFSHRTG